MKIVDVKPDLLKASDYNPRQMTEKEAKDLLTSIQRFGLVDPIIVNSHKGRENVVIGGHQRLKIALSEGFKTVPVYYVDFDEKNERELNLRLNKNLGGWNWDMLASFEKEMLTEVGFEDKELNKFFQIDVTEDEAPVVPKEAKSKLGDLYQLGNHRLLCGDATKKEDVQRLMDGHKADMVFTDPPYGVNYEGKTKDALTIQNDKTTEVFSQSIPLWQLQGGASVYVCCPAGNNFIEFEIPFQEHCHHSATIVWAKNSMVLGHGDYHYQHEPILYGWEKSATHHYYGDRKQTTLWSIDRPSRSQEHPTMKPIALIAKAIQNSSLDGHLVFDPFGGSGSTLIACEQLNRKCYMMEIDTKYIDVIIERWEKFTGKKSKKLN